MTLPSVFVEFASALEGKHPFSSAQLARLGELGNALVASIRPKNAPLPATTRTPEAILRDQLARLVEDRYDSLGVALTVAVGRRKADEMLPALRASLATPPTAPAAPVTPVAPT